METAIITLGQTIAICFPVEQTDAAGQTVVSIGADTGVLLTVIAAIGSTTLRQLR